MRFFKVNPRTENFSNIKKLLVLIEKVIKNLVYFLIVFINFFSFKKKKINFRSRNLSRHKIY